MKHQGYYTRALQANDQRFARVFDKMGYGRSDMSADQEAVPPTAADDLSALRDQYQAVVGKKPYHGWDADELRKRIAEADKAEG